jgi:hypothetical protein
MGTGELFSFPWPGPGNSEGPVDAGEWVEVNASKAPLDVAVDWETAFVSTSPWPGPGNSEG